MCFRPTDLAPCGVYLDHDARTLKPDHLKGDDYFGLTLGTNGSAAHCRRRLHEIVSGTEGYTWVRADGSPATGVLCIPTGNVIEPNVWG